MRNARLDALFKVSVVQGRLRRDATMGIQAQHGLQQVLLLIVQIPLLIQLFVVLMLTQEITKLLASKLV